MKIRGHRIELAELDAALCAHPQVNLAATVVLGETHERSLASFVTLHAPAEAGEDPRTALDAVRQRAAQALRRDWGSEEGIAAAVAALDRACLASLAAWLAGSGLFASATPLDFATLCQRLGIAEARQRLLRHWLRQLEEGGYLRAEGEGEAGWAAPSVPRRVRRTPGRRSPAARRRRSGRPSWSPTCVTARNPSASNWPGGSARRR